LDKAIITARLTPQFFITFINTLTQMNQGI
jgi:hypothetical protein